MNRRQLLAGAASLTVLSTVAEGQGTTPVTKVVAGMNTTGVPFAYREGTEYKGVMYDLLVAIAKMKGFTVEFDPLRFDAMIPALQVKQVDIAVSGFFITEVRKKIVDFTTPIHKQGSVLVVPANSDINDVGGLRGKTIAAEQGSAPLAVAQKHADEWGVTLRIMSDAANMKLAMQTGDVAGLIYDSAIVVHQMKLEVAKPTQKLISNLIEPTDIGYALPKNSPLLSLMNAGLAELAASGEIDRVKKNYDL